MTLAQTGALLRLINRYDGRPVDDATVESWHKILKNTDHARAERRVIDFFSSDRRRRILPSDVNDKPVVDSWMDRSKDKPMWLTNGEPNA